jgi:hypothetical protein
MVGNTFPAMSDVAVMQKSARTIMLAMQKEQGQERKYSPYHRALSAAPVPQLERLRRN